MACFKSQSSWWMSCISEESEMITHSICTARIAMVTTYLKTWWCGLIAYRILPWFFIWRLVILLLKLKATKILFRVSVNLMSSSRSRAFRSIKSWINKNWTRWDAEQLMWGLFVQRVLLLSIPQCFMVFWMKVVKKNNSPQVSGVMTICKYKKKILIIPENQLTILNNDY